MKVVNIKSACIAVESNELKILMDPWLVDGEYYGSWYHYPPLTIKETYFEDIDYIYISHIHPDHFSRESMKLLDKSIPVLIHQYASPFLKRNIEMLGFSVRELPHNQRVELENGVYINIVAADDCNPELCQKFMGCGYAEIKYKSTQIDSLCIIDNGTYSVMNLNDCPYDLAEEAVQKALKSYETIDFLLVGYCGAGPYPQCFVLSDEERAKAGKRKKTQFLQQGERYLRLIQPRYYMPFAGTYTLGGKLATLQNHRGVPEIEEAGVFYQSSENINQEVSKLVLLNTYEGFDLQTDQASKPYEPIDLEAKQRYVEEVLAQKSMAYETDKLPTREEIMALLPAAYQRMNNKRQEINFVTDTMVYIDLENHGLIKISMDGSGYELVDSISEEDPYVLYRLDTRLLKRILEGPRYAHWNNAEIGSHIIFDRQPNQYERGLYHSMCYFHK